MTYHTTARGPLLRVPNRKSLLISAAGAALGAAATVAVMAGWSAFGPVQEASASGRTTTAISVNVPVQPHYPASREGVRGQVFADDSIAAHTAVSAAVQPHYPASREGVRGPVSPDDATGAAAAMSVPIQPHYPASREGVRGQVFSD